MTKIRFEMKHSPFSRPALACLAMLSLSSLCAAQTAQSVSLCDGLKKFVNGKGALPFRGNHGALIQTNLWNARTQIAQGICSIGSRQNQQMFVCGFNSGASEVELASHYKSMLGDVQTCLNGLDSWPDWRKREAFGTTPAGQAVSETMWSWTTLRDQTERQILVSSTVGGSQPGNNLLSVLWRVINASNEQ